MRSHTRRADTASKRAYKLTSAARQRHLLRIKFINPAHQVDVLTVSATPITVPAAARSTVQRSNRVKASGDFVRQAKRRRICNAANKRISTPANALIGSARLNRTHSRNGFTTRTGTGRAINSTTISRGRPTTTFLEDGVTLVVAGVAPHAVSATDAPACGKGFRGIAWQKVADNQPASVGIIFRQAVASRACRLPCGPVGIFPSPVALVRKGVVRAVKGDALNVCNFCGGSSRPGKLAQMRLHPTALRLESCVGCGVANQCGEKAPIPRNAVDCIRESVSSRSRIIATSKSALIIRLCAAHHSAVED